MSVRTAQRRLREPEVMLAIEEVRVDLTRQAVAELTQLRDLTFVCLREVLSGDDGVQHKLRASELVLRSMAAADVAALREGLLDLQYDVTRLQEQAVRERGPHNESFLAWSTTPACRAPRAVAPGVR